MEILAYFLIGAVAGGGAAWYALSRRHAEVSRLEHSAHVAETAQLNERLSEKERGIDEMKARSAVLEREKEEAHERLRAESDRRSAAEALAARAPELETALAGLRDENTALHGRLSTMNARFEELKEARGAVEKAFKSAAADSLRENNQAFLDLAKTHLEKFQQGAQSDLATRQKAIDDMVKPVSETLANVDRKITELEKARISAFSSLDEQLKTLKEMNFGLRGETSRLVSALKSPIARGQWGEMQLRRVVEMAGMLAYCDFVEKPSAMAEGRLQQPDLIVRLPGGKTIVVDAKTPLDAYLRAMEATDEEGRAALLREHSQRVRSHIKVLSDKKYWQQFQPAPDFVVMFLPGEAFFSAALTYDPALIEEGFNQRVIPASPTTLIALLHAVAASWRQEKVAENAEQISGLGRELYKRMTVMAEHIEGMGKNLASTVGYYNKFVGSFESKVLTQARKFTELGAATSDEIGKKEPIDIAPRQLDLPSDGDEGPDVT